MLRRISSSGLLCLVLVVPHPGPARASGASSFADLVEPPVDLPCRFGVLGVDAVQVGPDTVLINRVRLRSPAADAGLRPGDRLIGVHPYRTRSLEALTRCVQSLTPGSPAMLLVRRGDADLSLACTVGSVASLYYLMGEGGTGPSVPAPPARAALPPSGLESSLVGVLQARGCQGEYSRLEQALRDETDRYGADGRLQDLERILRRPLAAAGTARLAVEDLSRADAMALVAGAAAHLDLPEVDDAPSSASAAWYTEAVCAPLRDELLEPFCRAGAQAQRALAGLSPPEQDELLALAPALLDDLSASVSLEEGDSSRTEGYIRSLRLAKRVDRPWLLAAGRSLAALASPAALDRIRRVCERLPAVPADSLPEAFDGSFRFAHLSPWGWILVGDAGPNRYGAGAAVIVDLGGDDLYVEGAGALAQVALDGPGRRPAALVIDFGGNDRYVGSGPVGPGGAVAGVCLLLDLEGQDVYRGRRLCEGAAFCGVGLLWDRAGDDVYAAEELAQGAGLFGAGLLVDDRGDDLYLSGSMGQGFGGPGGLGLLLDRTGRDRYLADPDRSSSADGTSGRDAWAQGVGFGIRGYAAGGTGLLLDLAGDDQYLAGSFAQGAGYFFGLGILVDRGGRDHYRAGRFAQGAAAHQAVGILLDAAGADRYRGGPTATQGAGWDAAIGLLEDVAGDDHYEGGELAQGAAAMNGVGVLWDRNGRDRYRARSGQGDGRLAGYWGGRGAGNLGALLDEGGRPDGYGISGRRDGAEGVEPGLGVFLDR